MRRFSQRNSLVTLSEINITPLLDLAFVLLIIFVITRPMLEGRVQMSLPESTSRIETPLTAAMFVWSKSEPTAAIGWTENLS